LWPDASGSKAKKYLRQALWQLQTALENCDSGAHAELDALFLLSPGWIRLNTEASWWLDVDVFEQAYALCRDLPGTALTAQQAATLEEAVAHYHGDLLETWYQDWCIFERERLQLMYVLMLEKLMGYCEARQLYTKGVAHGQRVLRHDQAREGAHRQLMRLYFRAGDRTAALRQYDRCVTALAKEFNLQPSQKTVALSQQIRADRLDDTPPQVPGTQEFDGVHDTDLILDLHRRLDQIAVSLSTIQHHVQQQTAPGHMTSRH
jgi:DNA-binding SARP family transcriptional activator